MANLLIERIRASMMDGFQYFIDGFDRATAPVGNGWTTTTDSNGGATFGWYTRGTSHMSAYSQSGVLSYSQITRPLVYNANKSYRIRFTYSNTANAGNLREHFFGIFTPTNITTSSTGLVFVLHGSVLALYANGSLLHSVSWLTPSSDPTIIDVILNPSSGIKLRYGKVSTGITMDWLNLACTIGRTQDTCGFDYWYGDHYSDAIVYDFEMWY